MQQKSARKTRKALREELESFLERKGRKLSERNARELEDYVKKQRKVCVKQLNSPSVEVMTGWPGLKEKCGGFGKRDGEEGEKKNVAVAAEGGLRKIPWEIEAERRERPEKIDIRSGGEEQEIQSVTSETKMKIKRFVAKYRLDAKATAKLENSSDGVAERIVETPMGRASNPSAYIS